MGDHYFVGEFIGMMRLDYAKTSQSQPRRRRLPTDDAVPAPDVPLRILEHRYAAATSADEKADLLAQIQDMKKNRKHLDSLVESIVEKVDRDNNDVFLGMDVFMGKITVYWNKQLIFNQTVDENINNLHKHQMLIK